MRGISTRSVSPAKIPLCSFVRTLGIIAVVTLLGSCQTINRTGSQLGLSPSLVYLSFDDGPNVCGNTTAMLLDVLKKYQIQALFSLLGENAERSPELVRRIHDEGHYIVNHGYADKWASKMDDDEFRENLIRGEVAISAALGFTMEPLLYRPHGGFYDAGKEKIFRDAGYTLVPSTVRVYDTVKSQQQQGTVMRRLMRKLEQGGGGIVLLHDMSGSHTRAEAELTKSPQGTYNRSWIPGLVDAIVPILLEKGFVFADPADLFAGD